jgi:periplasmic divalent cation tolerance protein
VTLSRVLRAWTGGRLTGLEATPTLGDLVTGAVTVMVTIDEEGKAGKLARDAVRARLAACGQVGGPITSVY